MFLPNHWPNYYKKSLGCEIWDLENKKYYDFAGMGVTACSLGYANKKINSAIFGAFKKGNLTTLNSFEEFDAFIGNLVSYLASNKKRNRLEVNAESLYTANSTINISAFYLDNTYKFDPRASLEITIVNETTNKVLKFPFSLLNNSFQVAIENLASGIYKYSVAVLGQNLTKSGQFVISDYQIEAQFTSANLEKLQKIAANSGGKVYHKNQVDAILQDLSKNESFYTIQKASKKEQEFLDWKWLLFIIIGLLSTEWFFRKYIGKI